MKRLSLALLAFTMLSSPVWAQSVGEDEHRAAVDQEKADHAEATGHPRAAARDERKAEHQEHKAEHKEHREHRRDEHRRDEHRHDDHHHDHHDDHHHHE